MVPNVTASTPQHAARKSQACLPESTGGRDGNSLAAFWGSLVPSWGCCSCSTVLGSIDGGDRSSAAEAIENFQSRRDGVPVGNETRFTS